MRERPCLFFFNISSRLRNSFRTILKCSARCGMLRAWLLGVALLGLGTAGVHAATLTVTNLNDSGSNSLRAQIAAANSGDTIVFQSGLTGTITLASTLTVSQSLTIQGPGANVITVSGNHAMQVFNISSGTVGISGLTITDGNWVSGGGILSAGTLTTLTLTADTFSGNTATIQGGAIENSGSMLAVIGCTFTGNFANIGSGQGAAIFNNNTGTLTVSGSTFSGNSAGGDGGVIYNQFTADISNSTFSGNSASSEGGAIYNSLGTLTVTNNTFSGNTSVASGGAIANAATLTANNNIFFGNAASINGVGALGGGIYKKSGTVSAAYNVFYNNLVSGSEDDCNGCTSANSSFGANPDLLPLGGYGGTTQTMLPLPGSSAICAGSTTLVPGGTTTDQRGFLLGFSCANGGVDAGAVQSDYAVVKTLADATHTLCALSTCSLRDLITGNNLDIDFDPSLTSTTNPGTITLGSALPAITGQVNIVGPGANQLSISGNNSTAVGSVLTVNSGAQVFLYGLTIANGNNSNGATGGGGGIHNSGTLTVMASAISGNQVNNGNAGGGIRNDGGTLTLTGSTVSGNAVGQGGSQGGGILNEGGTLTVTGSTVSGNSITSIGGVEGAGIDNSGTLTLTSSTVSGNTGVSTDPISTAVGGGIVNIISHGTLTLANSIVAGNSVSSISGLASDADISGSYNDNGGNQASNNISPTSTIAIKLSPLQLNGIGATVPTMIPLPGSPAICAGLQANIPSGTTTDERGYPNTNSTYMGYSSGSPCVDSGAVQTNYTSTAFVQQPTNTLVSAVITPSPTAEVLETDTLLSSNNTDAVSGIPVTLTLAAGSGTLGGTLTQTASGGVATFGDLTVSAPGTSDELATNAITVVGTDKLAVVDSSAFEVIGPVTQFAVSATSPVYAGGSTSVIVTAEDSAGNTNTAYTGTIQFTSTDTAAGFPVNYTFIAADNGQHTFSVTLKTVGSQTVTATDTSTSTITGTSNAVTVNAIPSFVVTTTTDSSDTSCNSSTCSLRDAITAANSAGVGNITFKSGVTGTITLGSALPALTGTINITGPGATSLTVSGGGSTAVGSVFTVNSGASVVLYGLTIANGKTIFGGGINSQGTVTVNNSVIASNTASSFGGGINNQGTLTVSNSTFSQNTSGNTGGAINNLGTLTLTESTVSGNTANGTSGGGIYNTGALTLTGSTISGNTVSNNSIAFGGGIISSGTPTIANSIVAGNSVTGTGTLAFADLDANYTDNGGNQASNNTSATSTIAIKLSPLQLNGIGATVPTMIPLPGSPAICAGLKVNIPSGITTDERGYPNTNSTYTGYNSATPCVDSGAVQTNYTGVAFVQQPTNTAVNTAISPAPTAEVLETDTLLSSNNTDAVSGIPITLTYSGSSTEISGTLTETTSSGVATFSGLTPNTAGSSFSFSTAAIPVVGTDTLAALQSNSFEVIGPAAQLIFTTPPPTPLATVGNAGTVTVQMEDAVGNVVTTATGSITLSVTGPGGYTQSYTATPASGVATFNLSSALLSVPGTYDYQASSTTPSLSSAIVAEMVTLGVPTVTSVSPSAGSTAGGTVLTITGTNFATPASVTIGGLNATNVTVVSSTEIMATTQQDVGVTVGTPANVLVFNSTGTSTANSAALFTYIEPLALLVTVTTDDATGVPANCPNQNVTPVVAGPHCSLRDAVAAANAQFPGITSSITFASGLGSNSTPGKITLVNGSLTLNQNATITGLGTTALVIDGNSASSSNTTGNILQVSAGVTASISNLTIQNASTNVPGLISQLGGAMYNDGTLMLTGVLVRNSSSNGHSGGAGIYNDAAGVLTLNQTTFANNVTSLGGGGSSGLGGAILNNGGSVTMTASTLTQNEASLLGGNLYSNGGTVVVANSTITGSSGTTAGGGLGVTGGTVIVTDSTIAFNNALSNPGVQVSGGTVTVTNSIVAANGSATSTGNCSGCTLSTGNLIDVNPELSVLGSYGGPTQTLVPLAGSPAICAGVATSYGTDQRGFARPAGSCFDIGAAQTQYAIAFVQEPANTLVNAAIAPAVTVTTLDHGIGIPGSAINLTLTGAGTLSGTLPELTDTTGTATFPDLSVNTIATGDTLTATGSSTLTITSNAFNITGGAPAITFSPTPATQVYGTAIASGSLDATATLSGSTVAGTIAYTTTISGVANQTVTAGTTVLPVSNYTITANFTPSNTTLYSATSGSASYSVTQAPQTINFTQPTSPVTYGVGSISLSATGGASGNAVTFSILSGAAFGTLSGANNATLTITGAGTIMIAANQAGNANYAAATQVTQTIVVNQATQTITFTPPTSSVTYGVVPITLSATGGASGNTVVFSVISGPGSIVGSTLTVTGAGTIVIAANQVGNTNYSAATQVTQSIVVSQATQAVTFTPPTSPVTYGVAPIILSATGGASGNAIVFSVVSGPGTIAGSTLTVTGAGTIVIAANQVGNTNYSAATQVTQSIVVNDASQTITFTPLTSPVTYGVAPITLSATGGASGNPVLYSIVSGPGSIVGNALTVTGAGTIVIAANQAGNANYAAATQVTQNIVVNQATQTITFTPPTSPVTYGVAPITLSATGGASGNAIVFSVVSGPGTIAGSTLTVTGVGTIVIAANQAGNANYSAATQVTRSLVVSNATLTIGLRSSANPVLTQNALTLTATVSSSTGTPTGTVTFLDGTTPLGNGLLSGGVATFTTSSLAVGSHSITAVYLGDANFASITSNVLTETIDDFNFTISSTSVTAPPNGTAVFGFTVTPMNATTIPASVTLSVSGLPAGATYTFSPATLPAGSASTTVTLTVQLPPITAVLQQYRGRSKLAPFTLALLLLPFAGWMRKRAKRLDRVMSLLLLLGASVLAMAGLTGCGGGNGYFGQPQQTYAVTVTGTSGTLSHSTTVTLTVE